MYKINSKKKGEEERKNDIQQLERKTGRCPNWYSTPININKIVIIIIIMEVEIKIKIYIIQVYNGTKLIKVSFINLHPHHLEGFRRGFYHDHKKTKSLLLKV